MSDPRPFARLVHFPKAVNDVSRIAHCQELAAGESAWRGLIAGPVTLTPTENELGTREFNVDPDEDWFTVRWVARPKDEAVPA